MQIASGGVTNCTVDLKKIFSEALKGAAYGLILAHNHPSGSTTPSDADIRLTHKVREAGKLLDIEVLEHLIITADGYFSFLDNDCL